MAEAARYRRKSDGHIVGPITVDQAKTIAGYAEGDWEKMEPVAPIEVVDDDAPAPKAASKRTRKPKAKPATPPAPPTSEEPAGDS